MNQISHIQYTKIMRLSNVGTYLCAQETNDTPQLFRVPILGPIFLATFAK